MPSSTAVAADVFGRYLPILLLPSKEECQGVSLGLYFFTLNLSLNDCSDSEEWLKL